MIDEFKKIDGSCTFEYNSVKYALHVSIWDWGRDYNIMSLDGLSFGNAYCYNDSKNFTLTGLNVSESIRKNGRGRDMQEIREILALSLGYKKTFLFVGKGTFQRKWYKRRGYNYNAPFKGDNRLVWLKKIL
jgi:hypothetical protein